MLCYMCVFFVFFFFISMTLISMDQVRICRKISMELSMDRKLELVKKAFLPFFGNFLI